MKKPHANYISLVPGLENKSYPLSNSRKSTIELSKKARLLYEKGYSIKQISKEINKSNKRTRELIAGVNQLPHQSGFKIIA